jgi:hypothetical protein
MISFLRKLFRIPYVYHYKASRSLGGNTRSVYDGIYASYLHPSDPQFFWGLKRDIIMDTDRNDPLADPSTLILEVLTRLT